MSENVKGEVLSSVMMRYIIYCLIWLQDRTRGYVKMDQNFTKTERNNGHKFKLMAQLKSLYFSTAL